MNNVKQLNNNLNISVVAISKAGNPDIPAFVDSLPANLECIILYNEQAKNNEDVGKLEKIKNQYVGNKYIVQYNYYYDKFRFDEVRNVAKDLASREWIISLDIDERLILTKSDIELMENCPEDLGGFFCVVSSLMLNDKGESSVESFSQLRIFRNNKNFTWTKRVHEQIANSIRSNGYKLAHSAISIRHDGYIDFTAKTMGAKHYRNIQLGAEEVAQNPGDKLAWLQMKMSLNILDKFGWFDNVVYNK